MASHWPHSLAMVRSAAWYASLKRVRSSRWRRVGRIRLHIRERQFVDRELFVDSGWECFGFDFAAERKDQGDAAVPPALADFVEAVFGRSAGILPDPVLRVAVALENIDGHLVAELAAEIDEQRDRARAQTGRCAASRAHPCPARRGARLSA
jgi:hypothetical protein